MTQATKLSRNSRREKIVRIWRQFGRPATAGEVAARCLALDFWSKKDRDRLISTAITNETRNAINKEVDSNEVPLALVRIGYEEAEDGTVSEVTFYVQPEFWTEGDALTWVKRRVKQLRGDYQKLKNFIENCCEIRWPEIDWWSFVPVKLEDGIQEEFREPVTTSEMTT